MNKIPFFPFRSIHVIRHTKNQSSHHHCEEIVQQQLELSNSQLKTLHLT
uniref:Uncharacterized protein n=1 Tax=Rhizophora mucronata TaxID=61149 RepID=A0A2P2JXN9_RHIMU